jgi:hypothetical protein
LTQILGQPCEFQVFGEETEEEEHGHGHGHGVGELAAEFYSEAGRAVPPRDAPLGAEWSELARSLLEPVSRAEPVLTAHHMEFWEKNGYVVLANAVPADNLARVRDETWAFLGEHSRGRLSH